MKWPRVGRFCTEGLAARNAAGLGFLQGNWLSGMDSNHDKGLQRALCYHYTTGQAGTKIAGAGNYRKGKSGSGKTKNN